MKNFIYLIHKTTYNKTIDFMMVNVIFCSSDYKKAFDFAKEYLKTSKDPFDEDLEPDDIIIKIPLDKKCRVHLMSYSN